MLQGKHVGGLGFGKTNNLALLHCLSRWQAGPRATAHLHYRISISPSSPEQGLQYCLSLTRCGHATRAGTRRTCGNTHTGHTSRPCGTACAAWPPALNRWSPGPRQQPCHHPAQVWCIKQGPGSRNGLWDRFRASSARQMQEINLGQFRESIVGQGQGISPDSSHLCYT